MLILVGVTITVALNGGLFNTAQSAATNTIIEAEKEQLLSAVATAYDAETGTISKAKLEANLGADWNVEGDIAPYTVTSPKGNKYTVNVDGTIGNYQGITLSLTEVAIKKIGGTAEITATLEGIEGEITWKSLNDEIATVVGNGNKATITAVKNGTATITATCGGKTTTVTVTVSSKEITLPADLKVGSEFEMDANNDGTNETWIVLYDGTADHLNENEIEVISKNTMGELALGKSDTEAIEKATDLDGNNTVEDIEKAIYSYNNAIDRINNYCASLIKIDNLGIRSVGSKPSEPSYRNTTTPSPTGISAADSWSNKTAWEKYGVLGEDGDTNYTNDWSQMQTLGIQRSDGEHYWMASRGVNATSGGINYGVYWVFSDGLYGASFNYLGRVVANGYAFGDSRSYAVRPVIKLQYP